MGPRKRSRGKKTSRGRSRRRPAEKTSRRKKTSLGKKTSRGPGANLGFHRNRAGVRVEAAPMSRGLVADGGGGGGSGRRWRWRRRAVAVAAARKNLGSPSGSSVRRPKNLAVVGTRAAYIGED